MYTKNKYNYRIENTITKLKIQHDHALISTLVAENFLFQKEKGQSLKAQLETEHLKWQSSDKIDKIRLSVYLL